MYWGSYFTICEAYHLIGKLGDGFDLVLLEIKTTLRTSSHLMSPLSWEPIISKIVLLSMEIQL